MTRLDYIKSISKAISRPSNKEEQQAMIEALCILTATAASAASGNSVSAPPSIIEETTDALLEVLADSFA